MNTKYSQLHRYLASIGVEMIFQAEENLERTCPLSISLCYNATKAVLFDKQRLLLFSHDTLSLTPDQIQNHVHILAKVYSLPLLFVFQTANREFCMSLIKKHLPFIISNRQCYIPDGLIAINEKGFRKTQAGKITSLSPIAQVILLYYLLHRELPAALPFQEIIAAIPNLSKVYVTRAAQELSSVGLCTIIRSGHFTHLNFEVSRRELWERAQTFLRSPVLCHIRLENEFPNLPLAGINALSKYSNLNNDEVQTVAMYSRDFDKSIPTFEYSGYHLELWRYNPRLLCGDGQAVDKLSLYLSLKDNKDPRVRGELTRMMEEFQW